MTCVSQVPLPPGFWLGSTGESHQKIRGQERSPSLPSGRHSGRPASLYLKQLIGQSLPALWVPVPTPTSCPFSLGWIPTDAGPRVLDHPNPAYTSVNNLFITLSSMTYFSPFFSAERNLTGGSEDPHLSQLQPSEWPQRLSEDLGMQVCGCFCVGAGQSGGEDPLGPTIQQALSPARRTQYLVSRKQGARTETSPGS